jgi:hypothetical protein
VREQSRLADSRVAAQNEHPTSTAEHLCDEPMEHVALGVAVEQPWCGEGGVEHGRGHYCAGTRDRSAGQPRHGPIAAGDVTMACDGGELPRAGPGLEHPNPGSRGRSVSSRAGSGPRCSFVRRMCWLASPGPGSACSRRPPRPPTAGWSSCVGAGHHVAALDRRHARVVRVARAMSMEHAWFAVDRLPDTPRLPEEGSRQTR